MRNIWKRRHEEKGGIIVTILAIVGLIVILGLIFGPCGDNDANAATRDRRCVVTTVVDEKAYTEVIPGTPEIWEVFSPNENPFDGEPTWPSDPDGTWQAAAENIPPGHEGPDGVYQMGEGNGSWFYRQAGTEDEVIEHDAVTHNERKCHPPRKPPVTPEPRDHNKPEAPRKNTAFTGADMTVPSIIGGAFALTGGSALWLSRRRRAA